jgi:dTDP-4-amino-4,6-dideoxygalactose transaminase
MGVSKVQWKIPLFKIRWSEEDVRLVTRAIKSGTNWAIGSHVIDFENNLSRYCGVNHSLVVNSGTSALHLLMIAYGIEPGDEVIVPSFTFISTANAVMFVGARPIFADIEKKTFGLDPKDVAAKITDKTKAIVAVHYAGGPCLIEELRSIARSNNILLFEDAAEAIGAKIYDSGVCTFGDASILSFCQNKIITTGEGGAVLTDSKEMYERMLLLRSHGRANNSEYFTSSQNQDYITLGYNFRMSNIVAALGCSQLKNIDTLIALRREKAKLISSRLSEIKDIQVPVVPEGVFHVFQMYPIIVKYGKKVRSRLMEHLSAQGIMTKVYFDPVHLTHFYSHAYGYSGGELPATETISSQILSLPIYPGMTNDDIDFLTRKIAEFFKTGTSLS